jgi:very-short-patch-repair endonuclease
LGSASLFRSTNRAEPGDFQPDPRAVRPTAWLAPWRGLPHPLSDIEQRLAKMLAGDAELAPLFSFNQIIETVRGSKPRVDLVWMEGRLVVELDGYPDHGSLRAFMMDRHRDYELTLSGYTVLRIANHEIAQDIAKAIEKIRDLVQLRRSQATMEG